MKTLEFIKLTNESLTTMLYNNNDITNHEYIYVKGCDVVVSGEKFKNCMLFNCNLRLEIFEDEVVMSTIHKFKVQEYYRKKREQKTSYKEIRLGSGTSPITFC